MLPLLRSSVVCLLATWLLCLATSAVGKEPDKSGDVEIVGFKVQPDVIHRELNREFCWFHPRAAAIPGRGKDGKPAVIVTLQKHLKVSDHYSGMWFMRSDDLGASWTGRTEIAPLGWQTEPPNVTISVADVTPGWHAASGKLILIGTKVSYSASGEQLVNKPRSQDCAYATFDPEKNQWSGWKMLDTPDPTGKFFLVCPGCVQWLVKPDGTLLVPIYYRGPSGDDFSVTVVHCKFDGTTLSYLKHGDEMAMTGGRGLCEPSLALYHGKYYLALRNDARGYVATSDDGLHFGPPVPWKFDDGQELGSYNTQAHWLAHSDGLFLSYTRRGAKNDHIFRHRAPLFVAQVDPKTLHVIRKTEQVLIPERGVPLGNFGAAAISPEESWVTDAEFIVSDKPDPRGGDGSTFAARVRWSRPNRLVSSSGKLRVKSQEISFAQRRPEFAAYEFTGYANPYGPEMIRLRFDEVKDDLLSNYEISHSTDHGRSWSTGETWESERQESAGKFRRMFAQPPAWNVHTGRLLLIGEEGILPSDVIHDTLAHFYQVYRTSDDRGKTWSPPQRLICTGSEFSAEHALPGVWLGKNAVSTCNPPVVRSDGAVLVPLQLSVLDKDGKLVLPPGAYTYLECAVLIGKWRDDGGLDWQLSQRVRLAPDKSIRGVMEASVIEADDHRILMVLRANDGHKWQAISNDGGMTWDAPRRWTYSDGKDFYSPSSYSRLVRHTDGTIYWIGNVTPQPPHGNTPRYPLVIGRVDPKSLLLERDSLTTIDTRREHDPPGLSLSNFCVDEDRLTGDLLIRMTRWNGVTSGTGRPVDASVHLYRVGQ